MLRLKNIQMTTYLRTMISDDDIYNILAIAAAILGFLVGVFAVWLSVQLEEKENIKCRSDIKEALKKKKP